MPFLRAIFKKIICSIREINISTPCVTNFKTDGRAHKREASILKKEREGERGKVHDDLLVVCESIL